MSYPIYTENGRPFPPERYILHSQKRIIQPLGQNSILTLPETVDVTIVSQVLVKAMSGLKIGVGNAVPDLVNLRQSHREAEEALTV